MVAIRSAAPQLPSQRTVTNGETTTTWPDGFPRSYVTRGRIDVNAVKTAGKLLWPPIAGTAGGAVHGPFRGRSNHDPVQDVVQRVKRNGNRQYQQMVVAQVGRGQNATEPFLRDESGGSRFGVHDQRVRQMLRQFEASGQVASMETWEVSGMGASLDGLSPGTWSTSRALIIVDKQGRSFALVDGTF